MKYISAQPETKYYEWQIDTLISSYLEQDVNPMDIIILLGDDGSYKFDRLRKKYKHVQFYSYPWKSEAYAPAIKPYLMSKYFGSCTCTHGEQYYYADADTILLKPLPYFPKGTVYMSNTRSYIGYDYIESKGEEILDLMAKTAGIPKQILKDRDLEAGGAQFVFDGTDSKFWKDVYTLSNALYREMRAYNQANQEKYSSAYPIQAWTAEMWATLWMFWKKAYKTEISQELDFVWATDPIEMMEGKRILHNAGVTSQKGMFKKSQWTNKYPPIDLNVTKTHCNYYYYKQVLKATTE